MKKESERKFRIRIMLALAVLFATLAFVSIGCASGTTHYVNPGESIQAAVNAADPYDTIIVRDGTYTENINVNKRLTIKSENGSAKTIVQAANSTDHVFDVTADYVNISGFMVMDATKDKKAGIYLSAGHCTISNNQASNNNRGIYLKHSSNNTLTNNNASNNWWGIRLYSSDNNILARNKASNSQFGIHLIFSCDNTLTRNNASNNGEVGIYLDYSDSNILNSNNANSNNNNGIRLFDSSNNTLMNNTMSGNKYNFCVWGDNLSHFTQNIDASNKVNEKPIYYLVNEQDRAVPNGAGCVGVVNSTNITMKDLRLTKNGFGILLVYSKDSRIENINARDNDYGIYLKHSSSNMLMNNNASNNNCGIYLSSSSNNALTNNSALNNWEGIGLGYSNSNTLTINKAISNNYKGIFLWYSSNNVLTGHNVNSNNWYGIYSWGSNNNKIYLNNFINNGNNVKSTLSTNIWNSTSKITYVYNETTYENYTGNYWSDYKGSDADGDGIGDAPYNIYSDADSHPLMEPWENYFAPVPSVFDTGAGTYPSIMGTHKGEIRPSCNINVSKLYTYPCVGTGGHTESIELEENGIPIANGTWNGYQDDYHNITINNVSGAPYVMLYEGHKYNYTIVTGSYPQIIHEPSKEVTGGTITCTLFTDANGKTYTDWIPAIKLE